MTIVNASRFPPRPIAGCQPAGLEAQRQSSIEDFGAAKKRERALAQQKRDDFSATKKRDDLGAIKKKESGL